MTANTTTFEYGTALEHADFDSLAKSYISAEVAISARLRRVSSEEGKQLVGRRDYADYSGVAYPYFWPGESRIRAYRLRRDNPGKTYKRGVEVEEDKYIAEPGRQYLYFHPETPASALSDSNVAYYVTEGQKKALALYRLFAETGSTAVPIGLNGVWGWRAKIGIDTNAKGRRVPKKGPTPDLERIEWTGRRVVIVFDTNTETNFKVEIARNELALELIRRGANVEFVDLEPEPGVNGVDDYFGRHGAQAGLALLATARPFDPSGKIAKLPYTDFGNEQAFEYLHGKEFLYDHTASQWLIWNGIVWEPDTVKWADRIMLAVAKMRMDSAAKGTDEKARKDALASAFLLQNMKFRKAALESAQSNPAFARRTEDFDQHDLLFAGSNGVLNLGTGEFGRGRRADMLMKKTEVAYNPIATCGQWLKFLCEVFPVNTAEMVEFLQRAIGYSLTGLTREEVLFILHGNGRNGKGTFLRVLSKVLGDYAWNTPFSTLVADRDSRAPRNDLAAFQGRRFITAQESKEGIQFDESTIKTLTGGDLITARFLFKEFFTFRPTWKIWLATNHKPRIEGTDDGIWSRPKLIPFEVSFEGREDKGLKDRLMQPEELSGILNWAVQGCHDYLRDGLAYPAAVTQATAEYKAESDTVRQFMDECCSVADGFRSLLRPLYEAFGKWCDSPITEKTFGERLEEKLQEKLKEKGYKKRGNRGMVYFGIAIRPVNDDKDEPGEQ